MKTIAFLARAACALLLTCLVIAGCGHAASSPDCANNVAVVSGTGITKLEFNALLKYTLRFYEEGNTQSKYYGKQLCKNSGLAADCTSVRKELQKRMIDQALVSNYAAAHNLIATSKDWNRALQKEQKLINEAGGQTAFVAYLNKLGTDEAQFRLLESQEIETGKVIGAMGLRHFRKWLASQNRSSSVTVCPLS